MLATRYVFAHLWPRALFIILVGWLLFALLEGMESARMLAKGTTSQVVLLYLLRAPSVIVEMLAPALVLGTLAGIGVLNRRAELAALAAGGRSLVQVALPAVLALSCGAVGARLALSELVMPYTTPRAVTLGSQVFGMRGPRYWAFYSRDEWFKAGPLYARAQPDAQDTYHSVAAISLDEQFRLKEILRAENMYAVDDASFRLENASITRLGDSPSFEHSPNQEVKLPSAAAALSAPLGYPEQFNLSGLRHAIARRTAGGLDVTPYKVALTRRFVDPVMLLFMGVLALALAVRQRREAPVERLLFVGGMAVAAAQGLVLASEALASKEWLPLWVVAAAAPLITAFAAVWTWRGVERAKKAR